MIFKLCITAAVLVVHLPIYEANTTFGVLQFWEPDPKFSARRHERNKTNIRGRPTKRVIDDPLKASYRSKPEIKRHRPVNHPGKASSKQNMFRAKEGRRGDNDHKSTRIDSNVDQTPGPKWWFTDAQNASKNEPFRLSPHSIEKQLIDITSKMPEANVTVEVLGRTAEYNDIVLLKVTEKKSEINKYFRAQDSRYIDEVPEKKIVFIVHALSVMGIDRMSVFKFSDDVMTLFSYYFAHLDKFDIFLIPMANPDGYAYVMNHVESVFWNKNRTPQNGCAGVALDRNFDVEWNASKTISSCSQKYPGPSPFSETETKAVRDVLHRYSHKIIAYMHLHSGTYADTSFKGDAVLYPKGYSDAQSDDDKYIDLKGEIDEAMKNASFKYVTVTVDTLYNWYGKVLGTSVDYASTVYGIPYAMELAMQIYSGDAMVKLENVALDEIWSRVIDVIFKSIWKNMHANDV